MMHVVTIPAHLDHRSLDEAATHLGAWPPPERILVDAWATQFSSPSGFTALLTLADAITEAGAPRPRLRLPEDDRVTSYWARAGFVEHAAESYEIHGRVPRRRGDDDSNVLLPLTAIRGQLDVHEVVDSTSHKVTTILKEELRLGVSAVAGFSQALSEMCQNVVEHAGTGGWVSAHAYTYRRRLAGRRVAVIAVSDAGIGFRRSLEATHARNHGDRWNDARALDTALIQGATRFRDPGRGQGLQRTKRYIAKWNGMMSIRSGTARIAYGPKPWEPDPLVEDLAWFPGSHVTLEIPEHEDPT